MKYLLIGDIIVEQPSLCEVKGDSLRFRLTRLLEADYDHML